MRPGSSLRFHPITGVGTGRYVVGESLSGPEVSWAYSSPCYIISVVFGIDWPVAAKKRLSRTQFYSALLDINQVIVRFQPTKCGANSDKIPPKLEGSIAIPRSISVIRD